MQWRLAELDALEAELRQELEAQERRLTGERREVACLYAELKVRGPQPARR
jgi:hypothetical protein